MPVLKQLLFHQSFNPDGALRPDRKADPGPLALAVPWDESEKSAFPPGYGKLS